eukprot:scaffold30353_cov27-Prasinocladus_malaysianus.AAC.2
MADTEEKRISMTSCRCNNSRKKYKQEFVKINYCFVIFDPNSMKGGLSNYDFSAEAWDPPEYRCSRLSDLARFVYSAAMNVAECSDNVRVGIHAICPNIPDPSLSFSLPVRRVAPPDSNAGTTATDPVDGVRFLRAFCKLRAR